MSLRVFSLVAAVLAASLFPAVAESQTLYRKFSDFTHDFSRSVVRDFKRNNCFPEPFVRPDRLAVRSPFNIVVGNGWKRQNMLGDYHFDETGRALNEMGKLKVNQILREAPSHHRSIYVHRARSQEETDHRIEAVRQLALEILPAGQVPAIEETNISMAGWPADRDDEVHRMYRESRPDPRLPAYSKSEL